MWEREREQLRKAMKFLHADEEDGSDYHAGMRILAQLVRTPPLPIIKTAPTPKRGDE